MEDFDEAYFYSLWEKEHDRCSTRDLLQYESIIQKKDLFGQNYTFDSSTRFLDFWHNLPNDIGTEPIIFRGVSDASFRLFSKAQRNFIANKKSDKNEFHNLIAEMIENSKKNSNGLLTRYFNAFGVKENDLSILSFLQHYGAPTPFLDWTKEFDIALYFAIANMKKAEVENYYINSSYDINSYFSIYILNIEVIKYYISDFKPLSLYAKKSNTYNKLQKRKIALIEEQYRKNRPQFFLENNLNILSQKGLFIYNHHPTLPLEEVIFKLSLMYYLIRSDKNNPQKTLRSPLLCININKGIVKHIKRILKSRGIHKNTIYPKPEYIAFGAIPKMLKGI